MTLTTKDSYYSLKGCTKAVLVALIEEHAETHPNDLSLAMQATGCYGVQLGNLKKVQLLNILENILVLISVRDRG